MSEPCASCRWRWCLDQSGVLCRCDPDQGRLLFQPDYLILSRDLWCAERNPISNDPEFEE